MDIAQAQADVRRVYRGGAYGAFLSGAIWLIAAAVTTWHSPTAGALALFFGGMLIFPLLTLLLRLLGGESALPKGHPMIALAMQTAFVVPIALVVALWLLPIAPELFPAAALVIVGAHYLPFVFLYGRREYWVFAAVSITAGVVVGTLFADPAPIAAWSGALVHIAFGVVLLRPVRPPRSAGAVVDDEAPVDDVADAPGRLP